MTIRRRRRCFVLIAGMVVVGGVWWWSVATGLSCKDAERIKDGMTREQVVTIFGRDSDMKQTDGQSELVLEAWFASDGQIAFVFNAKGIVVDRFVTEYGIVYWHYARLRRCLGF